MKKIKSIDFAKVFFAFLVIAVHTHPFKDINSFLYYGFSQVLVRIAVPFFFVVSGYFYIKMLYEYSEKWKSYIKRILLTYLNWSVIYWILQIHIVLKNNGRLITWLKSCIIEFFIYGSYYHLWYMVALIICMGMTTIFYKINKMNLLFALSLILYILGVIGEAYYNIAIQIPILFKLYNFILYTQIRRYILMGLPFFTLGYFIYRFSNVYKNIEVCVVITVILFISEIIFVNVLKLQRSIVITFFLYPLVLQIFILCLKYPMKNINVKINVGKLSSFIYFVHPLVIFILNIFLYGETLLYFLTCIVSTLLGLFFIKLNNKKINKLLF